MSTETSSAQLSARLLVVDDNEMNRDMLSRRLIKAGFDVSVADDGPKALDLVAAQGVRGHADTGEPPTTDGAPGSAGFDLILLDVMMPGIDGFEVLRRLREKHAATDLPVIMVTAKDQREDVVQALTLGASDYVTKPVDFPVVLARVQTQLALKRNVDRILSLERSLERRNADLRRVNQRMRLELQMAAKMQHNLLPTDLPAVATARFAWGYQPCEELAGDILNVFAIGDGHVAMYLLDVSGHGVPAALLSVTLSRLLSPEAGHSSPVVRRAQGGGAEPVPPAEVAGELNRRFPMDPETLQYFTLVYGVLACATGELRYVCAGHPAPIYLPVGGPPAPMAGRGFPIGWFPDTVYDEQTITLRPRDRVYLASDGISEAMNPAREQFGLSGIIKALEHGREDPIDRSVDTLLEQARAWAADRFADDVSALAVEAVGR